MIWLAALIPPLCYALWRAHRNHRQKEKEESQRQQRARETPAERTAREAREAKEARQRAEAERKEREAREARERKELAEKAGRVAKAREGDPRAFAQLMRKAGIRYEQQEAALAGPQLNYRLAKALRDSDIELVTVAGRPQMTDVDLQRKRSEEASIWPTDDIRPVPLTEPEQLMDVLPEDAILDDDAFYERFAQGELTAIQPYQEVKEYPLLAIVLDGSPSMDSQGPAMRNGFTRNVVARGIAANLLLRALDGNTRFLFRYFDSNPRELRIVNTPDEARALIERLTERFEEGSGTNVALAFKQTVADIRARGGEWTRAEVVLISDCEDNNLTPEQLATEVKGENIRFHIAQVGISSTSLKAVATSYREFL